MPSTAAVDLSKQSAVPRPPSTATDRLSTAGAELLKAKLASEPEIRPEVLARGGELAADPNYPSAQILGKVALTILQSPDPSEDLS